MKLLNILAAALLAVTAEAAPAPAEETTLPPGNYIPLCIPQLDTCTKDSTTTVNLFTFLECLAINPPAKSISTASKFNIPMILVVCPDSDCHDTSKCVPYNADPIGACDTPNFDIKGIYIINGWNGQFSPYSCPPSPSGCGSA